MSNNHLEALLKWRGFSWLSHTGQWGYLHDNTQLLSQQVTTSVQRLTFAGEFATKTGWNLPFPACIF